MAVFSDLDTGGGIGCFRCPGSKSGTRIRLRYVYGHSAVCFSGYHADSAGIWKLPVSGADSSIKVQPENEG